MGLRLAVLTLVILLGLLQARLWVSDDGFREVSRLNQQIVQQRDENAGLRQRNERLDAEIVDLRAGYQALEERARADLGLIGPRETFFVFGEQLPARAGALAMDP
jgi:cell division protein FtsB